MHVFASCARVCARIFTKFFLVAHYFVMSLSFKFHKDLIIRWGDICQIESCFFFCRYCMSMDDLFLQHRFPLYPFIVDEKNCWGLSFIPTFNFIIPKLQHSISLNNISPKAIDSLNEAIRNMYKSKENGGDVNLALFQTEVVKSTCGYTLFFIRTSFIRTSHLR